MDFINQTELQELVTPLLKSDYGKYLDNLIKIT